jgi:exopolysaccharide biosynthesis polyprenyl glycosylphosphotransferase
MALMSTQDLTVRDSRAVRRLRCQRSGPSMFPFSHATSPPPETESPGSAPAEPAPAAAEVHRVPKLVESGSNRAIIALKGFRHTARSAHTEVAESAHRRVLSPGNGHHSAIPHAASRLMTPPPAATQAAAPTAIGVAHRPLSDVATRASARLLDGRSWTRLRLFSDAIVLYLASSAALLADTSIRTVVANRWLAASFPIVVLAMLHVRRTPDERLNGSMLDTGAHVLGVVSLAAMMMIAVDSLLGLSHPIDLALRLWLFALVYLGVARAVLLSVRRHAMRTQSLATPTLILGAGVIGAQLVARLAGDPSYGLHPVGFLDADPLPRPKHSTGLSVPVIGGPDDLAAAIQATGARHVILAFSSEPDHVLVTKVRECEQLGIDVSFVPRLYESINERTTLDHVGGLPLLTLHSIDPRGWQFAVKHTFDRGFAFLVLLAASPVMLVIALAVRMSSPGPVLFRQRRVGRDGREFDVLKFRTMRETDDPRGFQPAEGFAPGGVEGQDRRTGLGRILRNLSLDELPQLVNVLRGDMSLVGPRPERPEFVARFVQDVARYEDRHRVKSGITGWAQVHGLRGQTSIADRVEWDNYYIQNWSLRLDLRIVALTIAEILRFRG